MLESRFTEDFVKSEDPAVVNELQDGPTRRVSASCKEVFGNDND